MRQIAATRELLTEIRQGNDIMETAREFLERRAADASPKDMLKYLAQCGESAARRDSSAGVVTVRIAARRREHHPARRDRASAACWIHDSGAERIVGTAG